MQIGMKAVKIWNNGARYDGAVVVVVVVVDPGPSGAGRVT